MREPTIHMGTTAMRVKTHMSGKPASASRAILVNKRIAGTNVSRYVPGRKPVEMMPQAKLSMSSVAKGFSALGKDIKKGLSAVEDTLVKGVKGVENGVKQAVGVVKPRVENRIGKVNKGLKQGMTMVTGGINRFGEVEKSAIQAVGTRVIHPAKQTIIQAAQNVTRPVVDAAHTISVGIDKVEQMSDRVFSQIEHVPSRLAEVVHRGNDAIGGAINSRINRVKTTVSGGVNLLEHKANNIANRVGHGVNVVGHRITSTGKNIKAGIGGVRDEVLGTVQANVDRAKNFIPNLIDTGKTIVADVRTGAKKKIFALLIGAAVVGFLVWDNTRDARTNARKFLSEEGIPMLRDLARNTRLPIPL